MMNIWDILEIYPTSDPRVIKKAYAKRSREVHPEEKPEEFSQLYEAYKSAMAFAKYTKQQDGKGSMQVEDGPGQSQEPQIQRQLGEQKPSEPQKPFEAASEEEQEEVAEVYDYFWKKKETFKKQVKEFQKQWDKILREYQSASAIERWAGYLDSRDFQEIQQNPQVLGLLLEKIGKPEYLEPYLALWDAYGFRKEKHLEYHGDILRLYESLLPAYDQKKRKEKEEQRIKRMLKAREKKKRIVILCRAGLVLILFLLCTGIPLAIKMEHMEDRRTISAMMQTRYPGDSFTIPEKTAGGSGRNSVYTFNSVNHPEIQVQAVYDRDDSSSASLQENYGIQILQYYGALYGLEFITGADYNGYSEDYNSYYIYKYVLLYSGIDDVGHVCDSLLRILDQAGDGELSFLHWVGICLKDARYPECMTGGGVEDRPPAQIYEVEKLKDAETLMHSVRDGWVDYMYNYEAWNLTQEQNAAYGPNYVARHQIFFTGYNGEDIPWSPDNGVQAIEEKFDLYIPIYTKINIPSINKPISEVDITVGNAYQFLKAEGAAVSVAEDGSGFTVVKDGKSYFFGDQEELNFERIKEMM